MARGGANLDNPYGSRVFYLGGYILMIMGTLGTLIQSREDIERPWLSCSMFGFSTCAIAPLDAILRI